ncbi:uncharacterized protein LOC133338843, partial [Musca vetustissima]|uniref:uncharacterized protein LOC133338843 n=1 Tax=Musca vetustissima TaxID=27455 RepID=UPI002AB7DC52
MKPEDINIFALEVRSAELGKVWKETEDKYRTCILYLETSEETTKETLESADRKFEVVYQKYMDCLSNLNCKLSELKGEQQLLNSSRSSSVASLTQHHCDIPREAQPSDVAIGSPCDPSVLLSTNALVLPMISGSLPSFSVSSDFKSQMPNLRLADVNLFDSRPVDLLLGADLYPKILLEGCRSIISGTLLAQNTVFGWLVTGPIPSSQIRTFATTINIEEEDSLNKTLLRFWELEETPKRKLMSPSDRLCEENYIQTTRRTSDGRYIVTLPLRNDVSLDGYLGESRGNVLKQFLRNESSLLRKPDIKITYDQVLTEYLDLDHMKPVSPATSNTLSCYLPHHPVINPEKQTTKLRVVFNASNKTSNGNSLNDILHVGPTLQLDLVLLILRWRVFKFVFNSDITQMYRQIRVDPHQTPLQRILYRDSPTKPIQDYELQTVTFGLNCAPYLAIRTLLQLADEIENKYPLAAHILRKSMYVDDVLAGAHDLETALAARDQLISALSSAKFELRKWTSNDKAILNRFPPEHLVDAQLLSFVEASSSKPLGISNMDASNMYTIDLIAEIDDILQSGDRTTRSKNRTTSEVLDELVRPIAAVKITDFETESVTAGSSIPPITIDTLSESVTAGSNRVQPPESVTAGSSAPIVENSKPRSDPIAVGDSVVVPPSESVSAGSSNLNRNCRVCNRRHSI